MGNPACAQCCAALCEAMAIKHAERLVVNQDNHTALAHAAGLTRRSLLVPTRCAASAKAANDMPDTGAFPRGRRGSLYIGHTAVSLLEMLSCDTPVIKLAGEK